MNDKEQIIERGLKDVLFDGWTLSVFEKAAQDLGHDPLMVSALFPKGMKDIFMCFSDMMDKQMIDQLGKENTCDLRTHEKIIKAVETRLTIMSPYKDVIRQSMTALMKPSMMGVKNKMLWQTADSMWNWAGDMATDYNYTTKRLLLSGVLASTYLYWLQDNGEDDRKTYDFLKDRIDNVLFFGKMSAPIMKFSAPVLNKFFSK